MQSKLDSCEKLEIPEAMTLDHEMLREQLVKAMKESGRIGKAAERVAQLCHAHFAKEEENIFRAFGLLHDLASDRMRPDTAAVTRVIAQFSVHDSELRGEHESINAAIAKLMQEARKEKNKEIAELISNLRNHETIEDEAVYPAVLQIARSVQKGMGFR